MVERCNLWLSAVRTPDHSIHAFFYLLKSDLRNLKLIYFLNYISIGIGLIQNNYLSKWPLFFSVQIAYVKN